MFGKKFREEKTPFAGRVFGRNVTILRFPLRIALHATVKSLAFNIGFEFHKDFASNFSHLALSFPKSTSSAHCKIDVVLFFLFLFPSLRDAFCSATRIKRSNRPQPTKLRNRESRRGNGRTTNVVPTVELREFAQLKHSRSERRT